jgi:hypothetical protein
VNRVDVQRCHQLYGRDKGTASGMDERRMHQKMLRSRKRGEAVP